MGKNEETGGEDKGGRHKARDKKKGRQKDSTSLMMPEFMLSQIIFAETSFIIFTHLVATIIKVLKNFVAPIILVLTYH